MLSRAYWLLKSEPADYSITKMASERRTVWDGVRNAIARKNLRAMSVGDRCLFYHSSCGKNVGVVGLVAVCASAYPDPVDIKWSVVDVEYVETFPMCISLETLKQHKDGPLDGMALFRQPRLSVQPVSKEHFDFILSLRDGGDRPLHADSCDFKASSQKKRPRSQDADDES